MNNDISNSSLNGAVQNPANNASTKRAVRVRFFRNGDSHYSGFQMALPADRYRTFDALLDDLTKGPVCDRNVLPQGVRYLFDAATGRRVRSIVDLVDGGAYVAASFDQYKKLAYGSVKKQKTSNSNRQQQQSSGAANSSLTLSSSASNSATSAAANARGRIAVILPGGGVPRPRKPARVLLNCRTAKSYDRVMADVSQAARLATGAVRRLYSLEDRRLVTRLEDFFGDASVFVAYGNEKLNAADFVLDEHDKKFINANLKSQSRVRQTNSSGPDTPAVSQQIPINKADRQCRMRSSSPLLEEDADNNREEKLAETDGQDNGDVDAAPSGSSVSSSSAVAAPRDNDENGSLLANSEDKLPRQPQSAEQSFDRLSDQMAGVQLVSASVSGSSGGGISKHELVGGVQQDEVQLGGSDVSDF